MPKPDYCLKAKILLRLFPLERLIRIFERYSDQLLAAARSGDRQTYDESTYAVKAIGDELKFRDPLAYEAWLETPTGASPREFFLTQSGRA